MKIQYKNRYGKSITQQAYINAYLCLYNGYNWENWNNCGISESEAEEVWQTAFRDITKAF